MEHLKMLRLLSYLLGLLIFPSVKGGIGFNSKKESLCVLQDEPRQCGSFCLAALNPLFDHSRNIRKRLDEIEAGQTALKDSVRMIRTITKEDFANSIEALQINTLKDTIKVLQSQLKVSEGQIKSQHEQIQAMEKTNSELSSQLSGCRKSDENLPDSCPSGSRNWIYQIKVRGLEPFKVPCSKALPGWTVIQRRIDGSENFKRTWVEYKNGFGDVSGEFFIGLEKLHRMTETRPHELYIKLGKPDGSTSYAHYDDFKIGSEKEYYELKNVGKHSGNAADALTYNTNQKFSTFDRDNDIKYLNCANEYGAWWHKSCSKSTLNGKYFKDGKGCKGIHWYSWNDTDWEISLTFVEIMIRPNSLFTIVKI